MGGLDLLSRGIQGASIFMPADERTRLSEKGPDKGFRVADNGFLKNCTQTPQIAIRTFLICEADEASVHGI